MNRGIMRYTPGFMWRDFDRMFDELSGLDGADFIPAIDVYQDRDNVIVETALSGIDPEKVDISIENDVLTISGKAEGKSEVRREDYYRKEIRMGGFSRSVILPMQVKGEQAEATYEKGILKISLPKAEEVKPKKIAIKAK
ncbi:MAG TPA: Hsp20/alpha crystallin family protein [Candidatus Moranbacteria bacterium]|nr:Hsp20/alpha crystallin family protein [Candidatus Moranbacteria bacterium]